MFTVACKFWENQQTCGQWHVPMAAPATAVAQNNSTTAIMVLVVTVAAVCVVTFLLWVIRSNKRRERNWRK